MGHRKLVRILELILYRENVNDRFSQLDGMIFVKLFGSSLVKRGVFEATRSPSTFSITKHWSWREPYQYFVCTHQLPFKREIKRSKEKLK